MMLTAGRTSRSSRSFGLGQVIEPYYVLQDAGTEVVVVSLLGGDPPFRGSRIRSARSVAAFERFRGDRQARDAISDTLTFAQIFPEDFDGGVCIGALERPAGDDDAVAALRLVAALLASGKPVAVVPRDLLEPQAPLKGALITGDQARSPRLAAQALLAALDVSIHRTFDRRWGMVARNRDGVRSGGRDVPGKGSRELISNNSEAYEAAGARVTTNHIRSLAGRPRSWKAGAQ